MTTFEVAHINEQGVNVVVVFLNSSARFKSEAELSQLAAELQLCTAAAGLAGNIALAWEGGFWAPRNQHAFFESPGGSFATLRLRTNKTLQCA